MSTKVIFVLCVVLGYVCCDEKIHVTVSGDSIGKMLQNAPTCIAESQVSPDILLQLRDRKDIKDPSFAKFAFCMLNRLGIGNKKGQLRTAKALEFTHSKNEDLKKTLDDCNKNTGSTPHETILKVLKCMRDKIDVEYKL